MRSLSSINTTALLMLIWLFLLAGCREYDEAYQQEVKAFQDEWNAFFYDSVKSPLLEEDRNVFKGLDFFPTNKEYRVEAELTRTPDEEPFEMPTTKERRPFYVKFGEAQFEVQGKEILLSDSTS